jgi:hypothetical protein
LPTISQRRREERAPCNMRSWQAVGGENLSRPAFGTWESRCILLHRRAGRRHILNLSLVEGVASAFFALSTLVSIGGAASTCGSVVWSMLASAAHSLHPSTPSPSPPPRCPHLSSVHSPTSLPYTSGDRISFFGKRTSGTFL